MTTKLRWMTIVVLAVLLSAGPVAALDGARNDDAPGVLAWVVQPLEMVWAWVSSDFDEPSAKVGKVQQLNGDEQSQSPPPGLEENNYLIQPGG